MSPSFRDSRDSRELLQRDQVVLADVRKNLSFGGMEIEDRLAQADAVASFDIQLYSNAWCQCRRAPFPERGGLEP